VEEEGEGGGEEAMRERVCMGVRGGGVRVVAAWGRRKCVYASARGCTCMYVYVYVCVRAYVYARVRRHPHLRVQLTALSLARGPVSSCTQQAL